MAWALGFGFWGIFASTVLGFVFCLGIISSKYEIEPRKVRKSKVRAVAAVPAALPDLQPAMPTESDVLISDSLDKLDRAIAKAAALADDQSTVLALFGFRKERERLLDQPFDRDLESEISVIVTSHFQELIKDYCDSRKLASPKTGARVDSALTETVTRLTKRLNEIAISQNERHIQDLETRGNYLRKRHPISGDDPFDHKG